MTFLYLFRHEMGLIPEKILSYVIAVTTTWFLNRCFTFHSQDSRRVQEWMRYAFIDGITDFIHVLIFTALAYGYPVFQTHPIFALIITAIVIAFINFAFTKYFAFKKLTIFFFQLPSSDLIDDGKTNLGRCYFNYSSSPLKPKLA